MITTIKKNFKAMPAIVFLTALLISPFQASAQIDEGYYLIKSGYSGYTTENVALTSTVLEYYGKSVSKYTNYLEPNKIKQENQIPNEVLKRYYYGNPYLNVSVPTTTKGVDFSKPTADMIWYIKPNGDGTYTILSTAAMAYMTKLFNPSTAQGSSNFMITADMLSKMLNRSGIKNIIQTPSTLLASSGYEEGTAKRNLFLELKAKYDAKTTDPVSYQALLASKTEDIWGILLDICALYNYNKDVVAIAAEIGPVLEKTLKSSSAFPLLSPQAGNGYIEKIAGSSDQYSIRFGDVWAMGREKGTFTLPARQTTEERKNIVLNYKTVYSIANLDAYDKLPAGVSILSGTTETPTADSQAAWTLTKLSDSQLPDTLAWGQEVIKRNFLTSENMVMGYTTEALATLKTAVNLKTFVEEILRLRAGKDNLRVKWNSDNVFDNLFRILNGGYRYYGNQRRELTVAYFKDMFTSVSGKKSSAVDRYGFYHGKDDHTAVSQIFKLEKSSGDEYRMTNPNITSMHGLKGSITPKSIQTKITKSDGTEADTTMTVPSYVELVADASSTVEVKEWDPYFFPGLFTIRFKDLPVGKNAFHTTSHPYSAGPGFGINNLSLDDYPTASLELYTGLVGSGISNRYLAPKQHSVYRYNTDTPDIPSDYMDYMSTWYLEPAKTIDLPVKRLGTSADPTVYKHIYSSFKYPFAVQIPGGVSTDKTGSQGKRWIYTERKDESSEYAGYVEVKPMGSAVVDKNVPVVIETENFDTLRLNIVKDAAVPTDAVKYESKVWKGALEPTELPRGTYMIMNHDRYGQGFFTTSKQGWSAPNRVYLEAGHTVSSAKVIYLHSFFDDSATTGIDDVTDVEEQKKTVVYYDLQGRRVTNPAKGIYVTSDGRKVVFN